MRIVAYLLLAVILLVILAMLYYLAVGALLFKIGFSKRSIVEKGLKKNLDKKLKEYKIDLCWWEKQKPKEVNIESFDGFNLVGYFLPANSDKVVLVVHGFAESHWQMQKYAEYFHQKNFNVLAVDNRAHGKSEGGNIGFGFLEGRDIVKWVEFINKKIPNAKIILFGLSMGGTAVCFASGTHELKNVQAVISDCAFANASNQIDHILKKYKLSLKILKKHLYSYAKRLYGLDVMQIDATRCVKDTKVPILFIHGLADEFVLPENLEVLYNSTPQNLRDKYLVEEAEHIMSYPVAGVLYEKKISDFIRSRTKISD